MVDAHEVIEVPDYSAYAHTQTVLTRADQLVPGDEILIPDARPPLSTLPVLRGPVYRVTLSQAAAAHDGPGWTLLTFGAAMARFRTEPHDDFHRVVEHDPPSCAYCLARFAQALQFAKDHKGRALNAMRNAGLVAYNRPGRQTMEEQLEEQQRMMRENGAG